MIVIVQRQGNVPVKMTYVIVNVDVTPVRRNTQLALAVVIVAAAQIDSSIGGLI